MAACYIDPNSCLSWDALFPYVLPYTLGVPDELMAHHIRLACIEFCRRSGILHDENILDVQKNVDTYFLTTNCDYQIIRVYNVTDKCGNVFKPSIRKPQLFSPRFRFWMENIDVLRLAKPPIKDEVAGLTVEFVVAPKQDGCKLDNYLYESWAEGIAYGAISKLMAIPNQVFSNPTESRIYDRSFKLEIARARTAVDMNFGSGMEMVGERFI